MVGKRRHAALSQRGEESFTLIDPNDGVGLIRIVHLQDDVGQPVTVKVGKQNELNPCGGAGLPRHPAGSLVLEAAVSIVDLNLDPSTTIKKRPGFCIRKNRSWPSLHLLGNRSRVTTS